MLWSPKVLRALEYKHLVITQTLVHLLYFSCFGFSICGVTAEHVRTSQYPAAERGGGGAGSRSPDGAWLIISTERLQYFWEAFFGFWAWAKSQ